MSWHFDMLLKMVGIQHGDIELLKVRLSYIVPIWIMASSVLFLYLRIRPDINITV